MKTLALSGLVSTVLILCAPVPAAEPANWPSSYPDWWYDPSALTDPVDPAEAVIELEATGEANPFRAVYPTNDYQPINQGQLLWMVYQASRELNHHLEDYGGLHFSIDDILDSDPAAYEAAANIGQLKNAASRFYDFFEQLGFQPVGITIDPSTGYPWTANVDPENEQAANIGQAKHLFSWDIRPFATSGDNDSDGLNDLWEWQAVRELAEIDTVADINPNDDHDNDGVTVQSESNSSLNPGRKDNPAVGLMVY